MKAVYLNNEDEQITFNGSMQEVLDRLNQEAIYISEVTSKELKEMLEMINETNICKYRNFMEMALIAVLTNIKGGNQLL